MLTKIKQYQTVITAHAARRLAQLKDVRTIGLLLFLVVLLLITWSGVKAIDTNYGLQKQIATLQQQNAVQKLANDNIKLQNDYLNTPQYLDIAARHDFGLAASGETVLVVPRHVALAQTVDLPQDIARAAAKTQTTAAKKPFYQRNFEAWMDFFLHREHAEN